MKTVKNFGFEVQSAGDGSDYDGNVYDLKISDLNMDSADVKDGCGIAEIVIDHPDGDARFQLTRDDCVGFIDVLKHIIGKVDEKMEEYVSKNDK